MLQLETTVAEIAGQHAAAQAAAEAKARRKELALRPSGPARRSARVGLQATTQRIAEQVCRAAC